MANTKKLTKHGGGTSINCDYCLQEIWSVPQEDRWDKGDAMKKLHEKSPTRKNHIENVDRIFDGRPTLEEEAKAKAKEDKMKNPEFKAQRWLEANGFKDHETFFVRHYDFGQVCVAITDKEFQVTTREDERLATTEFTSDFHEMISLIRNAARKVRS